MKNLSFLLILFISFPLHGQYLTKEKALEDLLALKEGIQKYNPALKVYNLDFDEEVSCVLKTINEDSVSFLNQYKYISQLCALSNEGHFSLGNWNDTVHSGFLQNRYRYLPISIKVLSNKIYLWIDNSAEKKLKRGDEIVEINKLPVVKILSKIYKAFPADGKITTYIDRNIELGFSWMYYFYVSQPDYFNLKVKDSTETVKEVVIKALTRDEQFNNYEKYYQSSSDKAKSKEDKFYELILDDDIATLRLPSFDYRKIKKAGLKAKSFYQSIFKELKEKQVKYLIIDLRGNTGGRNEFADEMVPHIYKVSAEPAFLKKTISWEGKTKNYKIPHVSKHVFNGKIYVLVDGRTYSAGSTLARYLKEFADAIVIGEETGTRYEGFAAGSKQYITLPNTKLKIGIPRYHILFPKSEKQSTANKGLIPDYQPEYTFDDILQKKDVHKGMANKLIMQDKSSN